MPVHTETITRAAGPGLLERSRHRPDAPAWRAAGAALAGFLVGSAGAGPAGWWATVAGLTLLALSTLKARPMTAIIAGALAGAAALGAWTATSGAGMLATPVAIGVAVIAGAAYGWTARAVQHWAGWPLLLPAVWLAMDASVSGAVPLPRVDPVAIAQLPGDPGSSVVALAAGPALGFLLGLASCTLATAVARMRRWSRARTVVGPLAAAVASLAILLFLESAVHSDDTLPSGVDSSRVAAPAALGTADPGA